MTVNMEESVYAAEDQLSRGLLKEAHSSALHAIKSVQDPQLLARGYSVLIQADFQCNKLTDLEPILQQCGHKLHQLPVPTILLWGVVAVELGETAAARATLGKYVTDISSVGGVSLAREDAMALSRLYAVQLLGSICHDFAAAAAWLEGGGAGLSEEQQELLLLELEEAEEVMQEERLADWAATHAAAAADHDSAPPPTAAAATAADGLGPTLKAAAAAGGEVEGSVGPLSPVRSLGTDAGSLCVSDLGPSASAAALSGAPSGGSAWGVEREDSALSSRIGTPPSAAAAPSGIGVDSRQLEEGSVSPRAAAAAAAAMGGICNGQSCWNAAVDQIVLGQGTAVPSMEYQQPLAAAAAAGSQGGADAGELDRASNSASPPSLYAWTSADGSHPTQQQQQYQQQQQGVVQLGRSRVGTAGTTAAPLLDNDFMTVTGMVGEDDLSGEAGQQQQQQQEEEEEDGLLEVAVGIPDDNAFCTMTGLLDDDDVSMPGHSVDPAAAVAVADTRSSIADSSSSNSSRDQQDSRYDKSAVGAGTAAGSGIVQEAAAGVQQVQQQSLGEWISSKASSTWRSQPVQATLEALNLQGLEPWEVAGGAGLLLLLSYSLYRKRRTIRRAAADLASGVAQTAQMALGMAINPMAAVPGTGHLSRP